MSIQAVAFVLDTEVSEVAAKMLLVCLANAHNHETGLCCPSISRLADESSMSRRSVQRWLKWLADEGFIEVHGKAADSGRQQANEYKIIGFGRGVKLAPTPNRGDTGDTGEGDKSDTLGGDTGDTPLKEPEEYRKNERERARVDFEEIWAIYPRRRMTNRSEAETEYANLSDDESHRCLVAAKRVRQWHLEDAASRDENPEQALEFRMGLAKWLRTKAWVEALTLPLKSDPVPPGDNGLVALTPDHPDFIAVQRMRGRPIFVGNSGKATFRIEEIEQAKAPA